mmetsp:Transcript_16261/g.33453  ORF Transcript_16261/g.33453 Transcript_16261/m.33453 type:complete len:1540 (+) Transcript_16261:147-4766(+)|eukprot:CAMPEP_0118634268 /NCGR_PEP_ID=MMETSP0785-20121206/1450_1 /TAXON_ID=91992 /ORGANISM="Bolidomonas pacifica, Strain CCMP 1866" /LENGTH=1539 /DNA_ID=CAMNT_0006525219 /DNA_START=52 /DNA_END=4671 /DNA_ORIENTATION=-
MANSTHTSANNIIRASHTTPLCFCSKGRSIRALNSETGETAIVYPSGAANISCLTMNPDLDVIASCDENNVIMVRASKTGNNFWTTSMRSRVISLVATDFLLFAMMENGRLTSFWLTDGSIFWSKSISKSRTTAMILVEHTLIVASARGEVYSVSVLNGETLWTHIPETFTQGGCITCLKDDDNGRIAYGTRGGDVVLRQAFGVGREGEEHWAAHHESQIVSIDVNATFCVTGSADGLVICWSSLNGSILWEGITFGRVNEVEICEGTDTVISCGDGKIVQLWDMGTGSIVWESKLSKTEVETVEFDGKSVVFSSHLGDVYYVNYENGELIWKDEVDDIITEMAVSSNTVALGYDSGAVQVFDLKSELPLFTNLRHKREISAICMTESSTVVTTSNDFTVRCTNRKGFEVWKAKGETQPTALLTIGQVVLIGYKNGLSACFDIQDGTKHWYEEYACGQEITDLHHDSTSNLVFVSQMNLRSGEGTLSAISLADGKKKWRMNVASEICGVATPDLPSFKEAGFVVTKYGGIMAFEKEMGRILGRALTGKSFPEIVSFNVVDDLLVVCCPNYVHLLEFNADSAGIASNSEEKKTTPFKRVWKSARIGKEGATIVKSVGHLSFCFFVTSNEVFILDTQHWKRPEIWSIYPTFHEESINNVVTLGKYIYTFSSKVVRHKMKYAELYSGLSVGREVLVSEDTNNGETSKENDSQSRTSEEDESRGLVLYNDESEAKDGAEKSTSLVHKVSEKLNYYEFRSLQFLQFALFIQRSAFAFKNVEAPISYDDVSNFIENLVDVMVVLPNIPFQYIFMMVIALVMMFLLIFMVQENVEFAKFMYPSNSRYQLIWTFMSMYCELCSGFFAIPIMTYLLKIFKCQTSELTGEDVLTATVEGAGDDDDDDDQGGDDDDEGGVPQFLSNSTNVFDLSFGFREQEEYRCYTSEHYVLLSLAVIALCFYVPMAIRFIRVDKKLECIEAKRNFFDWKSDVVALEMRIHAQSLVDTTAERASFAVGVGLTFVSTFITTELATVLVDFLIQAVFVITTHFHPPHFDKDTNRMALLLAYSTLYIFGVAVISTLVDDRYNPATNVLPFVMPAMLLIGTFWLYRDYLWLVYVKKVFKASVKDKKLWRSTKKLPSSGKVYISGDVKNVFKKMFDGGKNVVRAAKKAATKTDERTAQELRNVRQRKYRSSKLEKEEEESTSSSDEDDVVDITFGSARRNKRDWEAHKGKGAESDRARKKSLLQEIIYQLNFLTLLCSMALLGTSGFAFFYGANYDSEDGAYTSQSQITPFVAIAGVAVCTFAAVVQNEVSSYFPTFILFYLSATGVQHDFGVLNVLNSVVDCVSLPVSYMSNATGMFYEYSGNDERLWSIPQIQEENVFTQTCPFEAENGFLYSCSCCGDQDSVGVNNIFVVLRGSDVAETQANGNSRIAECLCFRAHNLVCDDVWDDHNSVASGTSFYKLTLASLIINVFIVIFSMIIILCSSVSLLVAAEIFFNKESVKAWKSFKATKVKELKKFIESSHEKMRKSNGVVGRQISNNMSER